MKWLAKYWKSIVLALGLIALSIAVALLPMKDWVNEFSQWVRTLGAPGILVFIAVYAAATVLFLPGWIFTVAAGLIYGIFGGTAVALSGATIGASLAFLCGRYLVRQKVEAAIKGNRKFAAIDKAIGEQGWKIVGLLRLSPLIPFNLSNYFYGVTAIGFWPYLLASAVGMIPGTLLYAYLGGAGKESLNSGAGGHSALKYILLGGGLLATVAVTIIVSRAAKKALASSGAAPKSK